jgi:dTDP-glucose 4,6-dehydratase/GDP-L-fucose synthase
MGIQTKQVIVTGGSGFLGSHVVEELESRGYDEIFVPRSSEYDLRKKPSVKRLYDEVDPQLVIHLAGTVGGIGVMNDKPGEIFYDNTKMALELIDSAQKRDIEKFVSVGSVCAYPKHTPVPFDEDDLWDGYPEETHAPYGIAKKLPLVQSRAYQKQYGFNGIYLLPVNLYGPRDDFDLKTAHVIPAIIRKVDRAKQENKDSITAWGTGEPTREFLYVEDAAEAIVKATEAYENPDPVNLGSGEEISIKRLIEMIVEKMEFNGTIEWDTSKPDGQPRRCLDTTRAKERFGWSASTEFEEGLESTIEWYRSNREEIIN